MEERKKISKAQQKAVNKYRKNNYDTLSTILPLGKRDIIKGHAASQGESLSEFVNRAIDETMERDRSGNDGD